MGNCELGTPTKTPHPSSLPKGEREGKGDISHFAFCVSRCLEENPPQSPFFKGGHRELLYWSRSVLSTQSFQIALSSLLWITFARFTRREMCFWLMDRRNAFISALAVHSRLFAFLFFADDHVGISLIHRGDRFAPRRTHRALQGSASHPRG